MDSSTPNLAKAMLLLMRPKQWVKNIFVLAPLLFAQKFDEQSLLLAGIAFVIFCLTSSATYIVNDTKDIEADRKHPIKSKKRPLAAGWVSKNQAIVLLVALYCIVGAGLITFNQLIIPICAYLAINLAYTFHLKHQPVLDIFCIAAGFVLRVYAGAAAIGVPLSAWMFITTLCLALYLAAIKRRQELLKQGDTSRSVLKHYTFELVDKYAEMAATGALLFYSLFVMTTHPSMVYTIPFVIYGLFRYWFVVEALEGGESPTDALYSDWQLIITVLGWVAACVWALAGEQLPL